MATTTIHDLGEVYAYDEQTEEEVLAEGTPEPDLVLSYEHMSYWAGSDNHGADLYFVLRRMRQERTGLYPDGKEFWLGFSEDSSKIAIWRADPRRS